MIDTLYIELQFVANRHRQHKFKMSNVYFELVGKMAKQYFNYYILECCEISMNIRRLLNFVFIWIFEEFFQKHHKSAKLFDQDRVQSSVGPDLCPIGFKRFQQTYCLCLGVAPFGKVCNNSRIESWLGCM